MSDKPQRKDFMTDAHKKAMGDTPRTHADCLRLTGVRRPGKTAKDRWQNGQT